ncbi:MAG: rhomboid family intramembrane serine protease [Phycisphaera sp.]|nr:rhomboid family intramembrane serine protease [Phycisphaera sp.]
MGIYDRDYARPGMPGNRSGGGFTLGKWSVNTWLIGICVAVFMLDALLPRMMATVQTVPVIPVINPSAGMTFSGIPEGAVVDPVDASRLRGPGLASIKAGKVPIWIEGPTRGDQPAMYFEQRMAKGGMLPSRFLVLMTAVDDSGAQGSAVGTITISDQAGNTQRQDVLLLQDIRMGGPFFVYGYFSTATALLTVDEYVGLRGFEFWRFISFQFLHGNLNHLIFNMLGLFFFGALVEQYLGAKRYLAFYLLCGIVGACAYLLLNFAGWTVFSLTGRDLPVLLVNDPGTPLVGASAGVFGVVIASAFLVPNARVLLFFVIPMKLSTLAYGMVGVALFSVIFGTANAGGEAAHIGGALAGYWLIRRPQVLHGFFDFLGRYDPTSRSGAAYRAGRLRTDNTTSDAEVDRILRKIHEQGLQSLSSKEKKALREASKR